MPSKPMVLAVGREKEGPTEFCRQLGFARHRASSEGECQTFSKQNDLRASNSCELRVEAMVLFSKT